MATMTNQQQRAHRALAAAEKKLIAHIVWENTDKIPAAEAQVRRSHAAWKRCTR